MSLEFLKEQIVNCSMMIVSVSFYTLLHLDRIKLHFLLKMINHLLFNRDLVLSHYDSLVVFDIRQLVPRMLSDVFNFVSLSRLYIQNLLYKILNFSTYKRWDSIVSIHDFSIDHNQCEILTCKEHLYQDLQREDIHIPLHTG